MYAVSERYLEKIKEPSQVFSLIGSINGKTFTHDDILMGSLSITNQCSEQSEVKIGSVYIAELKATFLTSVEVDNWESAVIFLQEGLQIDDGIEYVPFTPFNVTSADSTECGIDVTAYDNMVKFNKNFDVKTMVGTLYSMLQYSCSICGVELGVTEAEIQSMPNGTMSFVLYEENDIETHRDFIFWIAQTLACFCYINRDGKLVLRQYTQDVVTTIDKYHRFTGCSFSKYETRYSGISVVNIKENTTSYYGMEPDTYLTYNLGSNPLLQYGESADQRTTARRNVLQGLQYIKYAPFKATMLNGALYDLGDVVRFSDGIADGSKISCIMYYNYQFNRCYEVQGFGSNPELANARSKTDKNVVGLANNITSENELQFYTFINIDDVDIKDNTSETIIDIRYTGKKNGYAIFQAAINLSVETTSDGTNFDDAVACVEYYADGTLIESFRPTETWVDGKHILNLHYVLTITAGILSRWIVKLNMAGGSAHIDKYNIRASIFGQSLAASDDWGGAIDIEEAISQIPLEGGFDISPFNGSAAVIQIAPEIVPTTDYISEVTINDLFVSGFTDSLGINIEEASE